jgi:hypothetical protein
VIRFSSSLGCIGNFCILRILAASGWVVHHCQHSSLAVVFAPHFPLLPPPFVHDERAMSEPRKAGLFESMALGGTSAIFAVNFTHPIVRRSVAASSFAASVASTSHRG